MSGMPYPDLDALPAACRDRLAERLPLNIYRMLCHAPSMFPGWMDLGRAVLYEADLDPQLRELAILRIGQLSDSAYELHQHRKIAAAVGLSAEKIAGVVDPTVSAVYGETELQVLALTDQLVCGVRAEDALFTAVRERLGERQTMELIITVGFYMMVARVIENSGIAIEAGGGPSQGEVEVARNRTLQALSVHQGSISPIAQNAGTDAAA